MNAKSFIRIFILTFISTMASAEEPQWRTEEIDRSLTVGYAVQLLDMNAGTKPDIVVVDSGRVIWFENPSWKLHTIVEGRTARDNVCLAAHDIDGDGRLDLALGADWRPFDTNTGGTIQWLSPTADEAAQWDIFPIGTEPMVHRMRWIDLYDDGRPELVVVPLMGRGTTRPHFAEQGVRIMVFSVPADPRRDSWPMEVLNDELHVTHNFVSTDLDRDGRTDVLVVSFEGVHLLRRGDDNRWTATRIGEGNQQTTPNRGASEIKHGRLASGRDYLATIEPWHGSQVVVYTPPEGGSPGAAPRLDALWTRQVLDEQLAWGHAVWCANLDNDADEELIIGVRDDADAQWRSGVRIYDPPQAAGQPWQRTLVDPGGVAVEDLVVGDLNGDGRQEIIAVGRATKNVKIYWPK